MAVGSSADATGAMHCINPRHGQRITNTDEAINIL